MWLPTAPAAGRLLTSGLRRESTAFDSLLFRSPPASRNEFRRAYVPDRLAPAVGPRAAAGRVRRPAALGDGPAGAAAHGAAADRVLRRRRPRRGRLRPGDGRHGPRPRPAGRPAHPAPGPAGAGPRPPPAARPR